MKRMDRDLHDQVQTMYFFVRLIPICQLVGIGLFAWWVTNGGGNRYGIGLLTLLFILTVLGATLAALLFAVLAQWAMNRASGGVVNLIMGIRSVRDAREQMTGELDRARFFSRTKDYHQALTVVGVVLEKVEDHTEALALRAQILWEGFADKGRAREDLLKIMELTPKEDPQHRWAAKYYGQLFGEAGSAAAPAETVRNGEPKDET